MPKIKEKYFTYTALDKSKVTEVLVCGLGWLPVTFQESRQCTYVLHLKDLLQRHEPNL